MQKYSRQLKFLNQFIDSKYNLEDFQETISKKKLILVGCGGVGSVLAELLVRSGFLNLVLIDNDLIDNTNLSRQNFLEKDIGQFKSSTLKNYLLKINSKVNIKTIIDFVDKNNIDKICENSNLIIDATDNFKTRQIINDYCEKTSQNSKISGGLRISDSLNKKDWIYTGAVKSEIICCLFRGEKKYFKKVFPKKIKDESCCSVGVLSSTTFACASLAFNQILKYFLKIKENKLIKINLWTNKIYEINLK